MRKFLLGLALVFLLLPGSVKADGWFFGSGAGGGGSYPGFDYDEVQTFESALSGTWSEDDAGSVVDPASTSAKYVGAKGCAITVGATAGDIKWTPAGSYTAVSFGFWYYMTDMGAWSANPVAVIVAEDAWTNAVTGQQLRDGGDNHLYLITSAGTMTAGTWYWVTGLIADTSKFSVYNTSGVQVGSEVTNANINTTISYIKFGKLYGTTITNDQYIDEIYIDYTDATYPLPLPSGN